MHTKLSQNIAPSYDDFPNNYTLATLRRSKKETLKLKSLP
jgi:hypothetical protein